MSIVSDLLGDVDSILSIRDEIGAALKPVFLVTRTWSGTELGDGTATVTKTRMLPSPRIVEFKHDLKLVEGGFVKAGDVLLKMVSKQSYATENLLDGTSDTANVEKLYEVGGILYRPINVREKHVTWNVLLRRLSEN